MIVFPKINNTIKGAFITIRSIIELPLFCRFPWFELVTPARKNDPNVNPSYCKSLTLPFGNARSLLFPAILLFTTFLNTIGYSQEWTNLNPFSQPPGNGLLAVDFVDTNHGWAVGEWGIILCTSNGGASWEVQQNHTSDAHLIDIDFADALNGKALGAEGTLLHTKDGGLTWSGTDIPTEASPLDIVFINHSVGWLVGTEGLVLCTSDKGQNWQAQSTPVGSSAHFTAVDFVDSSNGWIIGCQGTILHTSNGGQDWLLQTSGMDWALRDVDFVDQQNGWIVGTSLDTSGTLRTTDGGLTWQVAGPEGVAIHAASAQDTWIAAREGYVGGLIKHTGDGGQTWEQQASNTENYLNDVVFIDETTGWAVGDRGTIIHTANGGQTWVIQQTRDVSHDMSQGIMIDRQHGWFAEFCPGRIWKTENGGLNWEIQNEGSGATFHSIEFVDTVHGWVVGETGVNRLVLRTVDGGESWEEIITPPLYKVTFFDSAVGIGGGDILYRTTDGGRTWQVQEVEPALRFGIIDMHFVDDQNGWAVGASCDALDAGVILNTKNGGETWQVQVPDAGAVLQGVYFSDQNHGCAVGSIHPFPGGAILITHDGGENWNYHYPPSPWLNDIFFFDASTGWAVGEYGFAWLTEDSGSTWTRVETMTHADLGSIVFVENKRIGYIFGEDNTLLKYDRVISGIQPELLMTPAAFVLYQNYPNPFNPITTVTYDLPEDVQVALIIYNILGEEVVRLVDGMVPGGYSQVVWNGKDKLGREVPSGIYISRLVTTEYTKSIKMVLMK
ncbi:MAG: YCF48-related protein [Candidatus Neomarinimicrobiota bacterium]